jgi:hypothetical protein
MKIAQIFKFNKILASKKKIIIRKIYNIFKKILNFLKYRNFDNYIFDILN